MSWWKQRSQLQSGESSEDVTPGGVVNRSPSPTRKPRGKKAPNADDYPSYAANTNRDGDNQYDGCYNGGGYGGGGYNNGGYGGGGGAPYGNDNRGITLYGNGGGYNNNPPPYGNVSDGYNAPASWGGAQDPAGRTPMYISTREVHMYGAPQPYDGDDQRRRGGGGGGGGGGGFFRPAFEAVGHFVDRRFGLDDRN